MAISSLCYQMDGSTRLEDLSTKSDCVFGAVGLGRFMQCAAVIRTKAESSNMIFLQGTLPTLLLVCILFLFGENVTISLNLHYRMMEASSGGGLVVNFL